MTKPYPSKAFADAAVEKSSDSRLANAWSPLWLAFAVTAIATGLRLFGTVDSDVAWQLWIAQRVHAGANLYTDIYEVNPPLWFWMAYPIERLASILHLRVEAALTVAVGLTIAASVTITNSLLERIPPRRREKLLAYAALTLMAMPWMHVGQREQIVLIGTLPYAALLAARYGRCDVSTTSAILVGTGFALGVALKHYFLIVPVVLELWLLARLRRDWMPLRAENLAIAAVGAVYALAVLLFDRDFLSNSLPMVRLAYGVTGASGFSHLFGPYAVTGLLTITFVFASSRLYGKGATPFASASLACAIAFAIIYFVQAKGWLYHAIPMLGCSALALAALIAEVSSGPAILRILGPAILAFPLLLSAEERRQSGLPDPELTAAVRGVESGQTVAFLSVEPAIPWSITLQRGFRYPSRYIGFWMMRAVVDNEGRGNPNPRLSALGRQVVSETVDDYLCTPPVLIVVDEPAAGTNDFDILTFFKRNPRFAALFSHYELRRRAKFTSYRLTSALPASGKPCRHGV